MTSVEGVKAVQAKLSALLKKAQQPVENVIVGYTQNYAIYVHEDLTAHHTVGQAKYLEQPARQLGPTLGKMIATAYKNGATINQALLLAGLRLQRESQQLVPVDTSALKASAFTCLEKDLPSASASAFAKSEAIRKASSKPQKKGTKKAKKTTKKSGKPNVKKKGK